MRMFYRMLLQHWNCNE